MPPRDFLKQEQYSFLFCGDGKTTKKESKEEDKTESRREGGPCDRISQRGPGKMEARCPREQWIKTRLGYFRSVLSCLAHGRWGVVSVRQELKLATDWF